MFNHTISAPGVTSEAPQDSQCPASRSGSSGTASRCGQPFQLANARSVHSAQKSRSCFFINIRLTVVTISGGAKPRPLHRLVLLLSQAAMANWGTSVHGWNEGQWDLEGGEYAICGAGLTSLFLRALNRPCPVSFFCCLQNGLDDQRWGEAPSVASSG